MLLLDKLSYASSLRNLNPLYKLYLSVGVLVICVATRSIAVGLLSFLGMGSLTLFWSKTPFRHYCYLLRIPLVFIALTTLGYILEISLVPAGDVSIRIAWFYAGYFYSSIYKGIQIFVTAMGAISSMYFLSLTTPMLDFLVSLRKLHCSKLMIELMLLLYRFVFLIFEIVNAIHISQVCRLGNRNMKTSLKSMGQMLAMTLVRALRQSDHLYNAMESRGFDGEIRILIPAYQIKKRYVAGAAFFHLCLLLTAIM